MRLTRWIFGRCDLRSHRGGDPGPRRARSCERFERALLISITEDLPARASRALERHLETCGDCREARARASSLRERCLEVASDREPSIPSLWAGISSSIEGAPAPVLGLPPLAWDAAGRRRTAIAVAVLSLAAAIALACLLGPSLLEKGPAPADRTILDSLPQDGLDSRLQKELDEFVFGPETKGDFDIDPFAPVIPNPDMIEF